MVFVPGLVPESHSPCVLPSVHPPFLCPPLAIAEDFLFVGVAAPPNPVPFTPRLPGLQSCLICYVVCNKIGMSLKQKKFASPNNWSKLKRGVGGLSSRPVIKAKNLVVNVSWSCPKAHLGADPSCQWKDRVPEGLGGIQAAVALTSPPRSHPFQTLSSRMKGLSRKLAVFTSGELPATGQKFNKKEKKKARGGGGGGVRASQMSGEGKWSFVITKDLRSWTWLQMI